MSKRITTILLLFTTFNCFSIGIDTNKYIFEGNQFIHLKNDQNRKLIIFLHGGVNNPAFKKNQSEINLDFILEQNTIFIPQSIKQGYDLILPIANDKLNWIVNPKVCIEVINKFISKSNLQYEEVYLAGFSDGATASFKLFYSNPQKYNGLVIFNGYPQHQNFNTELNYLKVNTQVIIYFGTLDDKTIPYEFMLTEYSKQKVANPNTYLYLRDGKHNFGEYNTKDFEELFDILQGRTKNEKKEAIHGFIKNDQLITFYEFRKSILKKYNYGEDIFKLNQEQFMQHRK